MNKEELKQDLSKLIDNEINRDRLNGKANIKDGGRKMNETIFINKIDQNYISKSEVKEKIEKSFSIMKKIRDFDEDILISFEDNLLNQLGL